MALFVIDGASLTPHSLQHGENLEALLDEQPFFKNEPLSIGPYQLSVNGQIDETTTEQLLSEFDILRKNKKYFDKPSTALFHCVSPLRKHFAQLSSEDIALYVNLGPANAKLADFSQWAQENEPQSQEEFTKMMASAVVQILPNVVMSNLAMNLEILGENTITSGTSVSSATVLKAATALLEADKCQGAIVASASFPCQYFNIDAFKRFFGSDFFATPLCEGASAIALTQEASVDALGTIDSITTFKCTEDELPAEILARRGFDLMAYEYVLLQPCHGGNFLAASEPFGLQAVLQALNKGREGECLGTKGKGLSVTNDYFGNYSAIEVSSRSKALSTG